MTKPDDEFKMVLSEGRSSRTVQQKLTMPAITYEIYTAAATLVQESATTGQGPEPEEESE